jgi:hypothetical protein
VVDNVQVPEAVVGGAVRALDAIHHVLDKIDLPNAIPARQVKKTEKRLEILGVWAKLAQHQEPWKWHVGDEKRHARTSSDVKMT